MRNLTLLLAWLGALLFASTAHLACSGKDEATEEAVEAGDDTEGEEAESQDAEVDEDSADEIAADMDGSQEADDDLETPQDILEAYQGGGEDSEQAEGEENLMTQEEGAAEESSDSYSDAAAETEAAPIAKTTAAAPADAAPVAAMSAPSGDGKVMYVSSAASVYSTNARSGSVMRRLAKGDHMLVTIEGEWARLSSGGYVLASALTNRAVGRARPQGRWMNP